MRKTILCFKNLMGRGCLGNGYVWGRILLKLILEKEDARL
jgi:hypothetical protein